VPAIVLGCLCSALMQGAMPTLVVGMRWTLIRMVVQSWRWQLLSVCFHLTAGRFAVRQTS